MAIASAIATCTFGGAEAAAAGKRARASASPGSVTAGAASGQPALDGKRVVALAPILNTRIEMPDQSFHDFGADFQAALTTRLTQSGKYIVADAQPEAMMKALSAASREAGDPDYTWPGTFVPSATVRVTVDAMTFRTGGHGDGMFYGFDENFRTPFNDGFGTHPNEFPLRKVTFAPNWFDSTFDAKSGGVFGTRSGLDLGEGLSVDVLFAWLTLKYALYSSDLHLRIQIDAPLAGSHVTKLVQVKGQGYFFDIVGAYEGYSAGIRIARSDAMNQALKKALDGACQAIEGSLTDLPLTARIDSVLPDGTLLLGTGHDSEVAAGVQYESVDGSADDLVIQVDRSVHSGSVAHVVKGDPAKAVAGLVLREHKTGPRAMAQALSSISVGSINVNDPQIVNLPWENFAKPALGEFAPKDSVTAAFFKGLLEFAVLPYRIWRYYEYDQAYKAAADDYVDSNAIDGESTQSMPEDWVNELRADGAWSSQIGLDSADSRSPASAGDANLVAVIDSGVDYNHPALHDSIWLNPQTGARKDHYGWDFISGDAHPFDDSEHGTGLASLIHATAPAAKILPLKVFNPWGITNSASIYGAFQYAVDHGAKIILCGWATRLPTEAVEQGVAYARDHGAVVVAAAGDRGDDLSEVPAYPAALADRYANVLTVTGVDSKDALVRVRGHFANHSPKLVALAAPGESLKIALPRHRHGHDTSTAYAAALAAGALAREPASLVGGGYSGMISKILGDADAVPGLAGSVRGGLRLHVR